MVTINSVNFDHVVDEALKAAKGVAVEHWDEVQDIVENISRALANDVAFIAKKKLSGEFNEDDARIYLEDMKIVARVRLRSLAIISMKSAERIWNAIAAVFRDAIREAIGWTLL